MSYFLILFASLFFSIYLFTGCTKSNLNPQIDIQSTIKDNNAPFLEGVINVSLGGIDIDQSSTLIWPEALDRDNDIAFYEVAINPDDGNSVCNAADFNSSSFSLDWTRVPSGVLFSSAGYQLVHSAIDGSGNNISLNLLGEINYCATVRATDSRGNVSNSIYSSALSRFYYRSCRDKLAREPTTTDGVHAIDPNFSGTPMNLFCDMTTQGGGWTLVIKYDSSLATPGAFSLPLNAGRTFISQNELSSINQTASFAASIDIRPFISNGATYFMHVGKTNDAATDSSTYVRHFFSDIYQTVIDDPNNLFNSALDSNSGDGVTGVPTAGTSATRKDRWYEANFTLMTNFEASGVAATDFRIVGGEGNAMFTNGSREGALYSSGNQNTAQGHTNPKVQWGFIGADGTQQTYGGTIYIGTLCNTSLAACVPESSINMMFVR